MNASFTLTCPGKIFLFGEYACLDGVPALLHTLKPLYAMSARPSPDGKRHLPALDPASPAGVFLLQHAKDLGGWTLEWSDPSHAAIGTGSSTAQFLLALMVDARIAGRPTPSLQGILDLYRRIAEGEAQAGLRPSGADLVAQFAGGPARVTVDGGVHFERLEALPEKSDARFQLAYTGRKVPTHEHLKLLRARGFPGTFRAMSEALGGITESAVGAWRRKDFAALGALMSSYQAELSKARLAPTDFTEAVEALSRAPGVLGCKGSGAQGGDCVLVLALRGLEGAVSEAIRGLGWEPIAPEWVTSGVSGF